MLLLELEQIYLMDLLIPKEKELALKTIKGYRNAPATYALWFKNPGDNVTCPKTFYGEFSGRFKNHCFYNPGPNLVCEI